MFLSLHPHPEQCLNFSTFDTCIYTIIQLNYLQALLDHFVQTFEHLLTSGYTKWWWTVWCLDSLYFLSLSSWYFFLSSCSKALSLVRLSSSLFRFSSFLLHSSSSELERNACYFQRENYRLCFRVCITVTKYPKKSTSVSNRVTRFALHLTISDWEDTNC